MLCTFAHPVGTCCDMLGIENQTGAHAQAQHCCTDLAKQLQHLQLLHGTPNTSQHGATHRNRVTNGTQHVAPNSALIWCIEMLRSFGRGFSALSVK